MATYTASVRYSYTKPPSKTRTGTSSTVSNLKSQSETLVMQKLHEMHKGCEIELIEIKWK